jgi:gliding motility-associated-like protein
MNNFNGSPNSVVLTASGANTYTWGPISGLMPNTLNGSTIIGTSSNGSAVGTVTVTGTVGTCSNTATFTVNAVPNPTISVTSGSMCAGTSVVLNASGASTYTWSPSNALNVINGPQVIANPLGTSIYNVIGSTAGCNSQTQSGTATVVPNPTVVITPANPFICFGKNISLTAIGATDYTWTPTIGLSSPNSANTIANPTITTTYNILGSQATCTNLASVTVTVINLPVVNITSSSPTLCMNNFNGSPNSVVLTASGANTYTWGPISGLMPNTLNGSTIIGTSSNGASVGTVTVTGTVGTCSNTATFTVNAVPNPTISVTSGSMCAGTSVVLNASGANTYTWSPSIGLNTISGPQVTANPTVTTVYNVIGTTAGCNSQTQIGLANVVPNPTITISPVNPYICFGNSVSLSASGATTYTWLPNTALSNTSAINVIANPTVTTTYTIIGSQATCTNTAINTVTVLPLPVPTITSSAQACIYTPVNLQTSPGYSLYQWTGPIGYSSNVSNATFTANTTAQTGTYNLSVTDAFGCIGTASTSIIINPLPSGILSRDDKNNCVPFCAVFKVNTTGSPIVNTVWQINYQTVFTPTLSYCLKKAGSYTVGALFSDANGCSNTATFTIKAYESPVANFAYSPINPTEGLETVTFTNTSTGSANSGWNWYFINNNGYLSNQPNTSYLFEQAGNYPVALVVKNKFGCSDTIIQVINVAEDHSLYVPNAFTPNYDGRNDVFLPKGRGISKYNLMVFDRWGQKLFESNEFTEGWDGTFGGVLCKNDVYIWKIIASFSNAKPKEYTGQIMLIK